MSDFEGDGLDQLRDRVSELPERQAHERSSRF
jgi:hypothetical protein